MKKYFLVFVLFFFFQLVFGYSINNSKVVNSIKADSVVLDDKRNNDSIQQAKLYLENFIQTDTLNIYSDSIKNAISEIIQYINTHPIQNKIDIIFEAWPESIPFPVIDTIFEDSIHIDTINIIDTVLKGNLFDSLIVRNDSILKDSIALNSIFNDSTFQDSLIIDTTVIDSNLIRDEIKDSIAIDTQYFKIIKHLIQDSTYYYKNDSLLKSLNVLVNFILKDSTVLSIYNNINDTLSVILKNDLSNNWRYRLTDDNGEIVGLRISSDNKNAIKLKLEPGTVIRHIKKQETLDAFIPIQIPIDASIKKKQTIIDIPKWEIKGKGSMNFNQGYVKNWVQGGESSISSLSEINLHANYSKRKTKWENSVLMKVGNLGLWVDTDEDSEGDSLVFRKNEDRFEINSKYGKSAFGKYHYSVLFSVNSQFFPGFEYPKPNEKIMVSKFLSPGYFIFSAGLDYKKNKQFNLMLSPLTAKFTTVLDTVNIDNFMKYGLDSTEKVKKEFGAYLKSQWNYNITEDISIENKINLFTDYKFEFNKIDVDWEVTLTAKVNEYIITTINTRLIWDYDVKFDDGKGNEIEKAQFKEYFSIGIIYKFRSEFSSVK